MASTIRRSILSASGTSEGHTPFGTTFSRSSNKYALRRKPRRHEGSSQDPAEQLLTSAKAGMAIKLAQEWFGLVQESKIPRELQIKVMIYCRWTAQYPYLAYCFAKAGLSMVSLSGSLSVVQRKSVVHDIQKDADHNVDCDPAHLSDSVRNLTTSRIALMSDVATEGLTLTRVSHVIVMDSHWDPSSLEQLRDRFVRQGQKAKEVHFFSCKGRMARTWPFPISVTKRNAYPNLWDVS
jgi:superfamily II DNA/RNA helicase